MSSSERFLATLSSLGYPGAESLDPQGFDWMFDDPIVTPFLDWFTDNIGPANLLHTRELNEFKELSDAGDVIDDGDLEVALQSLEVDEREHISDDQLCQDLANMTEELSELQIKKNNLTKQRNMLSMHHMKLSHKASQMSSIEAKAEQEFQTCTEQLQTDNTKLNTVLASLGQSVSDLNQLYGLQSEVEHSNVSCPVLLSQVDLTDYYQAEDKFTDELTAYTSKKFKGISEIANQDPDSRYQLLNIRNPDSLLIKGETEEVTEDECKEIERLQFLYPRSEAKRIQAAVEASKSTLALKYSQEKYALLHSHPYPQDTTQLQRQLQNVEAELATVSTNVAKLSEDTIPSLIEKSGDLELSYIQGGDYELKLARQGYFTSNQDQVIKQLVLQRARNEFLTMMYEIEAYSHRDTHKLLLAISLQLKKDTNAWRDSHKLMDDPAIKALMIPRETIDSRDKALTRVHNVLVPLKNPVDQKHQLFLSLSSLVGGAEQLHSDWSAAKASLSTANGSQENKLKSLEESLHACEGMVYGGSTTCSEPLRTPRPIVDALTKLEGLLSKLQQTVESNMEEVKSKKKVLKSDSLVAKERQVFTNFFLDPDLLRQEQRELEKQLETHRK